MILRAKIWAILVGCLLTVAWSSVVEDTYSVSSIKLGETKAVAQFRVTSTTQLSRIRIRNDSSTVPFSQNGIARVYISTSPSTVNVTDPSISFDASSSNYATIPFASPLLAGTYYVHYAVSTRADFSDGSSTVQTNVWLYTWDDDTAGSANITISTGQKYVQVLPSGLVYVSDKFKSIIPSQNVGPGLKNIPVMGFALRATDVTTNLRSITIYNKYETFAGSTRQADNSVRKVTLLREPYTAVSKYDGDEVEVATVVLPLTPPGDPSLLLITFNAVTINNSTNGSYETANDQMFYVLYDIGPGILPGESIACALMDASGISVPSNNAVVLSGTLPAGEQSYTIQAANLIVNDATLPANVDGQTYIAGCQAVRVLNFNISALTNIQDATVRILNAAGSFHSSDQGVSRVSLYQDTVPPMLVASTTQFSSTGVCELKNINFQSGNQSYYVTYDLGLVYEPFPENRKAQAQLQGITSGNVVMAGVMLAPTKSAEIFVTPTMIEVTALSVNITDIIPGRLFEVSVNIRNKTTRSVLLLKDYCRPKFYATSIEGQDISSEYTSVANMATTQLLPANTSTVVTFSVTAEYVKTNGPVAVDVQIGYSETTGTFYYGTATLRKYKDASMVHPAAELSGASQVKIINVTDATNTNASLYFPGYISMIQAKKDAYDTAPRRFVNNDVLPENAVLVITLANNGADIDKTSIINGVKRDGVLLHPSSTNDPSTDTAYFHFNEQTGVITIKSVGTEDAQYILNCSSAGVDLDPTTIDVRIADDGQLKVSELYPYPSPYNPDNGSCRIGFNVNKECRYSVRIYDAAGTEISSEKDIPASVGYNIFSWDGKRKNGLKVGRGVYLIIIKAKGSTETQVRTKVGVL